MVNFVLTFISAQGSLDDEDLCRGGGGGDLDDEVFEDYEDEDDEDLDDEGEGAAGSGKPWEQSRLQHSE